MEIPAGIADTVLERWPVARLATLTPAGRPHLVPIVFARHGSEFWSPVDAKPKRVGELARIRNVRAHPGVTLLLDHYDADWNRLWWLRVEGQASVIEGRHPAHDTELALVAAALRAKYPQYAALPLLHGEPMLLRIRIERLRSWCASAAALEAAYGSAGPAR